MGDSGPPEVFDKTENEEITKVDHPKSDKSNEDNPQDTSNQKTNSISTEPGLGSASEERLGRSLYIKVVKLEQRSKFLKGLGKIGVGTNRMEANQAKSRREMEVDTGRQTQEIKNELKRKVKDVEMAATRARKEREEFNFLSESIIFFTTVSALAWFLSLMPLDHGE